MCRETIIVASSFDLAGAWYQTKSLVMEYRWIFLNALKLAVTNPTFKKVFFNHDDLNNFRPIVLLPFLGKLLEKLPFGQLQKFAEESCIFGTFQVCLWTIYGKVSGSLCSWWSEKAWCWGYDYIIDHDIQLAILTNVGIPDIMLKYIKSFCSVEIRL